LEQLPKLIGTTKNTVLGYKGQSIRKGEQKEQQDQKKHLQNKPTENPTHEKPTTKEANKLSSEHFTNTRQGALFLNFYIYQTYLRTK
jgi:hypothetical protein